MLRLLFVATVAFLAVSPACAQAPRPTLVWERTLDIELPPPDALDGGHSLLAIRALAARADGGALLVVHPAAGGGRLIAFDGAGRTAFDRSLLAPQGMKNPFVKSAAINGDAADRAWMLVTWEVTDEDVYASQFLSVGPDGTSGPDVRLPSAVPPDKGGSDQRITRDLRGMRDGSFLALGMVGLGPPGWWFARFTIGGRLLHEAKSRKFPDYVEDAWSNADGGYTLLMVDAEGGPETVTLRRYGPDGRLAQRRQYAYLRQSIGCAALVGETRHMRLHTEGKPERTDIIVHDADRGIVRRIDLDNNVCHSLTRNGDRLVLAIGRGEATPFILRGLTLAGDTSWTLDVEARDIKVAATADAGALVLRLVMIDGKPAMTLARYRVP